MNYVTLDKTTAGLRITLTPEGRRELEGRLAHGGWGSPDSMLYTLLEDHLCNGWEWIRPEEIGALTSAPILSDESSREDEGLLTQVGTIYWFERYQVLCPVEQLYLKGHVDFDRAD